LLVWLLVSRKAHKKDQVAEIARKKRRTANKATARAIVGVSLEVINKKRTEKPEVTGQQHHHHQLPPAG
jgi:large subunit ribosomal protein L24e